MDLFDAVVVGGGMVGAATGYQLARAGVRTVVVDRADPGHATRAGAGIVCPVTATVGHDVLVDLAFAGAEHYPTLVSWLQQDLGEEDCGFSLVGMLSVGLGRAGVDHVAATAAWAEQVAATTPWGRLTTHAALTPDAAREHVPILTPHVRAALRLDWGGRVDGDRFRNALLEAARRRGAGWRRGTARLLGEGLVEVDGEAISCEKVILCGGAWSARLLPGLEAVRALRGEILHVRCEGLDTSGWPLIEVEDEGPYLIPWPGGRLAVGATVEASDLLDPSPTLAGMRWCIDALDRATGSNAGQFQFVECRVGFRPASADGLPLVGAVPDRPDVLVATGHGADGLSWGPFTGQLVTDLVLGDPPSIDLSPFEPGRFSTSRQDRPRPAAAEPAYAHARRLPA